MPVRETQTPTLLSLPDNPMLIGRTLTTQEPSMVLRGPITAMEALDDTLSITVGWQEINDSGDFDKDGPWRSFSTEPDTYVIQARGDNARVQHNGVVTIEREYGRRASIAGPDAPRLTRSQ